MADAKILIVEDDSIVAEDIQNSLKDLGFSVSAIVSSGEKAIKTAAENKPDLILMDIMLKDKMNGIEAADKIMSRFNIPIVYLTAHADDDLLNRANKTEPFGYILKPFENRELKIAIEMALYKHKMEKRLKESEEWLSTTLKSIGDGVIATDQKGYVKFLNPAAQSLTGWQQEDARGQPLKVVFKLLNQQTRKEIETPIKKILETGRIVDLADHVALISKEGAERLIADCGAPIWGKAVEKIGAVFVLRDITEKIRMEKQLRQSQKMEAIGTLSGGIAHDFNNILGIIIGFTELSIDGVERGTLLHDNLNEVLKAGQRAKDLVRQILTYSSQKEQEFKPIQVGPIVKEALKMLRSTLPATIEIKHSIETDAVILGDSSQIHQVFMNLCTNALYAMDESGGVLDVHLAEVELDELFTRRYPDIKPGPHLKLTVKDSGHGMTADVMQSIFDPYFTTKEKGEGMGLGLCVTYGIVKSHAGEITVESNPGIGSTFCLYLPAIRKDVKFETQIEEKLPGGNEKILFIDDEPAIARIGKLTLEQLGYEVTTRASGVEALELFRDTPEQFDLVITDIHAAYDGG